MILDIRANMQHTDKHTYKPTNKEHKPPGKWEWDGGGVSTSAPPSPEKERERKRERLVSMLSQYSHGSAGAQNVATLVKQIAASSVSFA